MSEWKPIETAPLDGSDILVCFEDFGRPMIRVARWSKNFRRSGYYDDYGWMMPGYQGIAHEAISPPPKFWMELAEPPK